MCGYNSESVPQMDPRLVLKQFAKATAELGDLAMLKVYTSGSFLDQREVPPECAAGIARHCAEHGQRLLFESRPEFVTDEALDAIAKEHGDLEIALGLESSNDCVLRESINKGFTFADYREAASRVKSHGMDVRTYVLLKPPFLSESEAIQDAKRTIHDASSYGSTLSLNPVNVQTGTLVEKLWKTWSFRPPWLWSVLEVLRSTDGLDRKIICDPTGGGRDRGAHNCGKCDEVVLDSLRTFSLSQDYRRLGQPFCECRDRWESVLALEDSVMGGTVDLQRFFRKQRA